MPEVDRLERRVLLLAPFGEDAVQLALFLERSGYESKPCVDFAELERELSFGAGTLVLTEEALAIPDSGRLGLMLSQQPSWSDLPVIILSNKHEPAKQAEIPSFDLFGPAGNATVIERPMHSFTLLTAVRTAVKSRMRQYERRAAEEMLLETNRSLAEKNKELEQFAYISSHDLQEPLRKIVSFCDRLTGSPNLSAEEADYVQRMQKAGRRMRQVIEDLLEFSRLRNSLPRYGIVELNEVFEDLLSDLDLKIHETGAKVHVNEMPRVIGNAPQLKHLFQNLLLNSLKFSKQETAPVIRVTARSENGHAFIRVEDNGIGFDPVYSSKIFEPFQRLHTKDKYEGTGIGLAICRKIVLFHHGEIAVETAPDRGASFTVKLPTHA